MNFLFWNLPSVTEAKHCSRFKMILYWQQTIVIQILLNPQNQNTVFHICLVFYLTNVYLQLHIVQLYLTLLTITHGLNMNITYAWLLCIQVTLCFSFKIDSSSKISDIIRNFANKQNKSCSNESFHLYLSSRYNVTNNASFLFVKKNEEQDATSINKVRGEGELILLEDMYVRGNNLQKESVVKSISSRFVEGNPTGFSQYKN